MITPGDGTEWLRLKLTSKSSEVKDFRVETQGSFTYSSVISVNDLHELNNKL
jgi:hypothetical protein